MVMEMIYISGPMTGYPDYNRKSFNRAERFLRSRGYRQIFNPASAPDIKNIKEEDGILFYLARDLPILLLSCDSIALLDKWHESRGARCEAFVAASYDKKIYRVSGDASLLLVETDKAYVFSKLGISDVAM